jgi:Mrp family chromosome partitioning ATPase
MHSIEIALQKAKKHLPAPGGVKSDLGAAIHSERRHPRSNVEGSVGASHPQDPPRSVDATWSSLGIFSPSPSFLRSMRIVTADSQVMERIAFDMLRTKLIQKMKQNGWTSLAITSPRPACGKTLVASNLALSLSNQSSCRTVVVDLDLRHPEIARTLGIHHPQSMEEYLTGRIPLESIFLRYRENVAVAANGRHVQLAAELLQDPRAASTLRLMKESLAPDIVIYDMPPMMAFDDVLAFLPNVDCALLVLAAEESTIAEADICEYELAQRTNVLGTVLNKSRYALEKYGY